MFVVLLIQIIQLFSILGIDLHHNYHFSTSQVLSSIVLGYLGGLNRISKVENFSPDPLVQRMLGLPKAIDTDTISNRINRFEVSYNNKMMELIEKLSSQIYTKLGTCGDIIKNDSSVFKVQGNQEGAEKGYNPYHIEKKVTIRLWLFAIVQKNVFGAGFVPVMPILQKMWQNLLLCCFQCCRRNRKTKCYENF